MENKGYADFGGQTIARCIMGNVEMANRATEPWSPGGQSSGTKKQWEP